MMAARWIVLAGAILGCGAELETDGAAGGDPGVGGYGGAVDVAGGEGPDGGGPLAGGGAATSCEHIYGQGHGDLYVGYDVESGALTLALRSELRPGKGEQLYSPSSVCIDVPLASYDAVVAGGGRPAGADWAAVGVEAGEGFWLLPSTPLEAIPWFGISTEGVADGLLAEDRLQISYAVTSAPAGGEFSQYGVNTFGAPTFLLSTVSDLSSYERAVGIHEHLSWTFSRPGEWVLEVVASGTHSDGTHVESAPTPFRFRVAGE